MKIKIYIFLVLIIVLLGFYFLPVNLGNLLNQGKPASGVVTINNMVINVELAQTSSQQAKGLGDRDFLAEDAGMLFIFPDLAMRNFWMKGMRFPLDIIWIKDDAIVGIEANAPIPFEKTEVLPLYKSPVEVNYVLEVNAGFCEKNGIKIGDKVSVDL